MSQRLHLVGSRLRGSQFDQNGGSAVEFALIMTPLVLLLSGVVDLGLGIWTYNNLAEATDEGARFAIVRGAGSPLTAVGPLPEDSNLSDTSTIPNAPVTCDALTANHRVANVVCQYGFPLEPSRLSVLTQWGCNVNGDPDNCAGTSNTINQLMRVEAHYAYTPLVINGVLMLVGGGPIAIEMKSVTRMPIACCN